MNLQDKKTFLEEFGNRVKRTRIEKGMTLEELANKIGYTTENARSSAQKIEAGRSDPPASKIRILAKVLDVSVGYLMGWDTAEYTAPEDKEFVGRMLKNLPPLAPLSEEVQALKYLLNQFNYNITKSTKEKDKYLLMNSSGDNAEIEESNIQEMSKGATDQLKIIADKLIYKYLAESFGKNVETPGTRKGGE